MARSNYLPLPSSLAIVHLFQSQVSVDFDLAADIGVLHLEVHRIHQGLVDFLPCAIDVRICF